MATSVNPLTIASVVAASNPKASGASADPAAKLVNEQTFLQLLVAQIKNQDPLNPSDSMQFVSQLAQFSELEQVIGVRQDIGAIREKVAPPASASDPASASQQV